MGLFAIRDDEDVAEVLGVPTYRLQLVAFALSCFIAGLIGGIHAMFVDVRDGRRDVLGRPRRGRDHDGRAQAARRFWYGPAIGAAISSPPSPSPSPAASAVLNRALIGAILIAVIVFLPDGVAAGCAGAGGERP